MNVIERIKSLMDEKSLTRADLVALSGLKKSTVYNLFASTVKEEKIELETIRGISKVLDVTMDYLIYGEEKEKPASDNAGLKLELALNKVGLRLSDLDKLDDNQVQLITAAVDNFLQNKSKG